MRGMMPQLGEILPPLPPRPSLLPAAPPSAPPSARSWARDTEGEWERRGKEEAKEGIRMRTDEDRQYNMVYRLLHTI